MKSMSRRTFLRTGALPTGMGVLAAAGMVHPLSLSSTPTPSLAAYPPVTLFNTESRMLTSSSVGQDYEISVWLPPSYASSHLKYPVVYVLDGNILFGLATSLGFPLSLLNDIPEVILVGIGVPITSYDDWINQRNRDLTPTAVQDTAGSGGAAKFLDFIETELLPFINSNYRVDSERQNIFGDSLGGLFVLYALLQRPGLFRGLVAGSPAVTWDNDYLSRTEDEFAASHAELSARLYLSVGAFEGPDTTRITTFADKLQSRSYQGLRLTSEVLENETHASALARAYVNGLKFVLRL